MTNKRKLFLAFWRNPTAPMVTNIIAKPVTRSPCSRMSIHCVEDRFSGHHKRPHSRGCVHIFSRQGEFSLNYLSPHCLLFCSVLSTQEDCIYPSCAQNERMLPVLRRDVAMGLAHVKQKRVHNIKSRKRRMIQKTALLHAHHEGFLSVYHSEGCLNVTVFLHTISGASRFMYREYTRGCSQQTNAESALFFQDIFWTEISVTAIIYGQISCFLRTLQLAGFYF